MSTSGLSDEAFAALQRLVRDLWAAAQDPKVARDPAAVARWQVYGQRQAASIVQREVELRVTQGGG